MSLSLLCYKGPLLRLVIFVIIILLLLLCKLWGPAPDYCCYCCNVVLLLSFKGPPLNIVDIIIMLLLLLCSKGPYLGVIAIMLTSISLLVILIVIVCGWVHVCACVSGCELRVCYNDNFVIVIVIVFLLWWFLLRETEFSFILKSECFQQLFVDWVWFFEEIK